MVLFYARCFPVDLKKKNFLWIYFSAGFLVSMCVFCLIFSFFFHGIVSKVSRSPLMPGAVSRPFPILFCA